MSINSLLDTSRNKQKVALITGAGQGIGAEIADCFAADGYAVALIDCNQELGLAQAQKLGQKAKFFPCDLADPDQVHALAKNLRTHFHLIDTIIHNARSPAREKDLLQNLEKEWDAASKVMLKHPILLNHLLIDSLKKSENPSILFIGSTNAHFVSQQPLSYHVMKGALAQCVRYLACEYGPYKIRVNLLNPGIVDVPGRSRRDPSHFQKIVERAIPLKRAAAAKEVGHCCLFFASDEAKYLTGTTLDLDGGEHLKDHFHLLMSHSENSVIQTNQV